MGKELKNKYKIASIIVTYNRADFLLELINALLKQTYPLSLILIIDNSTNDKTAKLLFDNGYIFKTPPEKIKEDWETKNLLNDKTELLYIKTSKNRGGAGGFNLGLKIAYDRGYELFWLMDDDVEPLEDALEVQLHYLKISKCITPSKKAPDGEYLEWWGWLNLKNLREYPIPSKNIKGDYAEVNMMCFEGALIHRNVVSKIGFPNPKFFIYGDDVVYGYKASLHTKCIHLLKPTFIKKLKKKNFHKRFGKYYPFASHSLSYYLMRNYLLKAKEIKSVSPGKVNMGFVYLYHFYYFLKQLIKALIIEWDLKKAIILIKGFKDSFKILKSND